MAVNTNLGELKKRALLAKQRMRMGYWQALHEERSKKMAEFSESHDGAYMINQMYKARIDRDDNLAVGMQKAISDEALYQKVVALLESDEIITNPIGKLVEKEFYDTLDEGNRQKYILDLSKKFRELKARYSAEQAVLLRQSQ